MRRREFGVADLEFDARLERVRKAAEVIGSLPTKALQADAFHYLIGQPIIRRAAEATTATASEGGTGSDDSTGDDSKTATASNGGNNPPAAGKKSSSRKSKPSGVNPDKALELAPAGKQSFADFAAEKQPSTQIEKYTVCVYWMLNIADYQKATIAQIVTCYHAMNWALPADVRNTASQAGKKEFDNSAGLDDIKLSSLGRNLVLGLPKQDAKKK